MMHVKSNGVYSDLSAQIIATPPATGKRKTDEPKGIVKELLRLYGEEVFYTGTKTCHTIDVFGKKASFQAKTKDAVFKMLERWANGSRIETDGDLEYTSDDTPVRLDKILRRINKLPFFGNDSHRKGPVRIYFSRGHWNVRYYARQGQRCHTVSYGRYQSEEVARKQAEKLLGLIEIIKKERQETTITP